MATYLIHLKYFADGDPEPQDELKRWLEDALDGGAMSATVLSIDNIPDDEEEE